MKRIDNETTVLLESPFKRHTFYAPKRVFNIRNLALASIALAVFCGIGAGAITVNVGGTSKVWAQAADTGGPAPQGNTTITAAPLGVVTTPQGLDGSQQKNLDEVRAKEVEELKAKARSVVPQPANVKVAQGTPCVYGANLSAEDCAKAAAFVQSLGKPNPASPAPATVDKTKAATDFATAQAEALAAIEKAKASDAAFLAGKDALANAKTQDEKLKAKTALDALVSTAQANAAAAQVAIAKANQAKATASAAGVKFNQDGTADQTASTQARFVPVAAPAPQTPTIPDRSISPFRGQAVPTPQLPHAQSSLAAPGARLAWGDNAVGLTTPGMFLCDMRTGVPVAAGNFNQYGEPTSPDMKGMRQFLSYCKLAGDDE